MAKTLAAVAAATLLAFVAVTASPAFRPVHNDADLEAPSPLFLHNAPALNLNWINVTDMLQKMEDALGAVQDKIDDMSDMAQGAVEGLMNGLESAALAAAGRWNATVIDWADRAARAGVDVQDCIQDQDSLGDVVTALVGDAQECVASSVRSLGETLDELKAIAPRTLALIVKAKDKVLQCTSLNPVKYSMCLATTIPGLQLEAAKLAAEAASLATVASAKVAALGPLSTLCMSKASAARALQAAGIVNQTVSCIQAKLSASTPASSSSTSAAPSSTSTLAPSSTSTLAPSSTSTLEPSSTSTLAPSSTSTLAPSSTSTLAPASSTTVTDEPTTIASTTIAPSTAASTTTEAETSASTAAPASSSTEASDSSSTEDSSSGESSTSLSPDED